MRIEMPEPTPEELFVYLLQKGMREFEAADQAIAAIENLTRNARANIRPGKMDAAREDRAQAAKDVVHVLHEINAWNTGE
jgi:hypothetical protein